MMKIVLKQPGLKPEVIEVEKIGLDTLQHYCEGLVTCPGLPHLNERGISLWANDEGLCIGMKPNIQFFEDDWFAPMDLVGPILLTGHDGEGETVGLTDEQIAFAVENLNAAEQRMNESAADGNTRRASPFPY